MLSFTFTAEVWFAEHSWVFLTVPDDVSDEIVDLLDSLEQPRRGFGSVKVEVTVGDTTWSTSLFPDKGRGAYILPVKKAVRDAEHIDGGDAVVVSLTVLP